MKMVSVIDVKRQHRLIGACAQIHLPLLCGKYGLCFVGNISPLFVVGFMNNAAADVEIMPAVVSSIFSLIPSPPALFFLGKKRHLSCWMRGTPEIVGQTRGIWDE